MAEQTNSTSVTGYTPPPVSGDDRARPLAYDSNRTDYIHTSVSSGFNQHTPAYWRLALPALGARYGFRWMEKLLELGASGKGLNKIMGLDSKRFFDAAAGAWMLGITAFFFKRTKSDIKHVFAETVAYELDKDPNKITFADIVRSHNNAVAKTVSNFTRYNTIRALVNTSFFASFLPKMGKLDFPKSESVDLGLGLNGLYLTGEVIMRNTTFFEELQNFIDRKISQRNALGEDVKPIELMRLFERNAQDNDKENAFKGDVSSPIWYQSQAIFTHMAQLMNRTYQHSPDRPNADFTLPKFLYLIGHNLVKPSDVKMSMAFIDIADRYGMNALKKVVRTVKEGTPLADAVQPYGIELYTPQNGVKADRISPPVDYADKIVQSRLAKTLEPPPASHTEKLASQQLGAGPALSA